MGIEIDLETKSYADLAQVGVWAYSEHTSTDIICACYAVPGDSVIRHWVPGDQPPVLLFEALRQGHTVEAHNLAFEFAMWHNVLAPRYGWPLPAMDQWRDSMAAACYYAMPASLDRLASALKYEGKDAEGGRLITKYSKLYLKTAKPEIPEEDLEKFIAYCRKDVMIEQSVSDELGPLPDREMPMFLLDLKMNHRGLLLDLEGIKAATEVVEQRAAALTEEFRGLTGVNPTQNAKYMQWLAQQGVVVENLQAEYLEELLESGLAQGPARRSIEIRLRINKASTKKLDAMARQAGRDGRARFQSRYHGAQTGRQTGTGFQPLNLNRGMEDVEPDQLVRDIMYRDAAWLDCLYGDATDAVAKASRHWIIAAPGHRIMAGDFVSVEAVILSCLAGEEWKIDAFRRKVKIYEMMADKIYNLPPGTVTKKTHPQERQDGKTGELAFGYQGALGAWLKFDNSGRHTDERIVEICKAWRAEHPAIVEFWRELERQALDAVRHRRLTGYRQIGFEVVDEWLSMILPDGKRIWYRDPEIRHGMPSWHKPNEIEECKAGTCGCQPRAFLTYMAQKEGQWKRVATYGGKLTENATQATARQRLVPSMLRLEKAGYPLILSVYDEIVAEVPNSFGSIKEFADIMREPAGEWDADWPIDVDVWEGDRYKK
jgi:DNA polymerase